MSSAPDQHLLVENSIIEGENVRMNLKEPSYIRCHTLIWTFDLLLQE
jgi:hypothetical protein